MAIGIIVAISPENVIGKNGQIPWYYSGDLRRFKRVTLNSTIIMGRATWDSIGKPLPKRRNIVITSRGPIEGVETFSRIEDALASAGGEDVWFIGGARIYEEAMHHADLIDVTYVPDHIDPSGAVLFPTIDESVWAPGPMEPHENEQVLEHRTFVRSPKVVV